MTVSNPALTAFVVFAAYLVLVTVMWRVNHVEYARIAESRDRVLRGIVVPIGLGAALLAVAVTVLGWWRPVLFDDGRTGPAWALVVPALFLVAGLVMLTCVGWRSENRSLLPLLAIGVLLVGFAEEVATRGVLVVGLRDAGWSEGAVFLGSTVAFALLHGLNALFGQPLKLTLLQIGTAFLAGSVLYMTRLSTGTLLVGIVLHALWDFGTLGTVATRGTLKPVVALLAFASYLLALVALWVTLR